MRDAPDRRRFIAPNTPAQYEGCSEWLAPRPCVPSHEFGTCIPPVRWRGRRHGQVHRRRAHQPQVARREGSTPMFPSPRNNAARSRCRTKFSASLTWRATSVAPIPATSKRPPDVSRSVIVPDAPGPLTVQVTISPPRSQLQPRLLREGVTATGRGSLAGASALTVASGSGDPESARTLRVLTARSQDPASRVPSTADQVRGVE